MYICVPCCISTFLNVDRAQGGFLREQKLDWLGRVEASNMFGALRGFLGGSELSSPKSSGWQQRLCAGG